MNTKTTRVCVKVSELRKIGYSDLEDWMSRENNLYTGRRGRVWIHDKKNGTKRVFSYQGSKWGNPAKDNDPVTARRLYSEHLQVSGLIHQVGELKGKNLGCFCLPSTPFCHANLLMELADKLS